MTEATYTSIISENWSLLTPGKSTKMEVILKTWSYVEFGVLM
jgi:hypothetical protein